MTTRLNWNRPKKLPPEPIPSIETGESWIRTKTGQVRRAIIGLPDVHYALVYKLPDRPGYKASLDGKWLNARFPTERGAMRYLDKEISSRKPPDPRKTFSDWWKSIQPRIRHDAR